MNDIIFVLEDMKARMPTFQNIGVEMGMQVRHAETVDVGKHYIQKDDPKIIFLDHDLGGKTFVDSNKEQTGVHLARWIAANDEHYQNRIIVIHSMNPAGAVDISNALNGKALIISFSQFYRNIKWISEYLTKMLKDGKA